MEDKDRESTRILSSDPKDLEKLLRDRLLDIYQKLTEINDDETMLEGKSLFNLLDLLGKGDKSLKQADWNSLLLFLALFPARNDIFDSQ